MRVRATLALIAALLCTLSQINAAALDRSPSPTHIEISTPVAILGADVRTSPWGDVRYEFAFPFAEWDLDKDGRPELLVSQEAYVNGGLAGSRVLASDALTGGVRWAAEFTGAAAYVQARADFNADGCDDVVVTTESDRRMTGAFVWAPSVGAAAYLTEAGGEVKVLDCATGHEIWSHHTQSLNAGFSVNDQVWGSAIARNPPAVHVVLGPDAGADPIPDVLAVDAFGAIVGPHGPIGREGIVLTLLDGSAGAPIWSRAFTDPVAGTRSVALGPDLSGDGRADYYVARGGTDAAAMPVIEIIDSRTGDTTAMWSDPAALAWGTWIPHPHPNDELVWRSDRLVRFRGLTMPPTILSDPDHIVGAGFTDRDRDGMAELVSVAQNAAGIVTASFRDHRDQVLRTASFDLNDIGSDRRYWGAVPASDAGHSSILTLAGKEPSGEEVSLLWDAWTNTTSQRFHASRLIVVDDLDGDEIVDGVGWNETSYFGFSGDSNSSYPVSWTGEERFGEAWNVPLPGGAPTVAWAKHGPTCDDPVTYGIYIADARTGDRITLAPWRPMADCRSS